MKNMVAFSSSATQSAVRKRGSTGGVDEAQEVSEQQLAMTASVREPDRTCRNAVECDSKCLGAFRRRMFGDHGQDRYSTLATNP